MLPLPDSVRPRHTPVVTRGLLLANVAVFARLSLQPEAFQARMVGDWGVVPARLVENPFSTEAVTLVTSMFLHGGWLHLGSNMLALWIFGDNVEDRLGRSRYLALYVLGGIAAGLFQVASASASPVPGIGASGAIAAVLAAYVLWYPGARVLTFLPLFILPWLVEVPALVFIGLWFITQLIEGIVALDVSVGTSGGVAWWAHVGGFIAGMALMPVLTALGGGMKHQEDGVAD